LTACAPCKSVGSHSALRTMTRYEEGPCTRGVSPNSSTLLCPRSHGHLETPFQDTVKQFQNCRALFALGIIGADDDIGGFHGLCASNSTETALQQSCEPKWSSTWFADGLALGSSSIIDRMICAIRVLFSGPPHKSHEPSGDISSLMVATFAWYAELGVGLTSRWVSKASVVRMIGFLASVSLFLERRGEPPPNAAIISRKTHPSENISACSPRSCWTTTSGAAYLRVNMVGPSVFVSLSSL
jgi:hypothetical protein